MNATAQAMQQVMLNIERSARFVAEVEAAGGNPLAVMLKTDEQRVAELNEQRDKMLERFLWCPNPDDADFAQREFNKISCWLEQITGMPEPRL